MTAQDRKFFQQGINMYVKAMQASSDLLYGQPTVFQLGTPAVSSGTKWQTGIAANSAANTLAALATVGIADSPYGRTVIYTPSGDPGNSNVVDVIGQDYLGQPMKERFTGASGSTAILYGKKAFFRIISSQVITPSSNAVTYSIGTGLRLGLPFKCDLAYAREANVQVPFFKRDTLLTTTLAVADAVAGVSLPFISQFPGFVKSAQGSGTTTGTAGNSVLTASLAGTAITGLSLNIPNNTAAFNTGNPGTPGYNANNRFVANSIIVALVAALASAKGVEIGLLLTPTQFLLPDLTDPATNVTGDPRGTYEALLTYDGVSKIEVGLVGDNAVNASNNGGLCGIQHFFA